MQQRKNNNFLYIVFSIIIPIVMIGLVYYKVSVLVSIAITLSYFLFLNKYELSAVLMLAFPQLLGIFNNLISLNLPASVILFLLVIVLLNVKLFRLLNHQLLKTFVYTSIILLLFFISAFVIGGHTESSISKLIGTLQMALTSLIGFAILFSFPEIDFTKVAVSFIIVACLFLCIAYDFLLFPTPSSIFDFSSFRAFSTELQHQEIQTINYHRLGYCGVFFMAYSLLRTQKGLSLFQILLSLAAIWVTLFSGARQAILAMAFIIVAWYLLKSRKSILIKLITMSILLISFYYVISSLEVFQALDDRSSGATGSFMNRDYEYPLRVISENTLVGIGFGNYYDPYGGRTYAHNIVLEILSEMGIVGLLTIMIVLIIFLSSFSTKHKIIVLNDRMGLLLLLPYLTRCFVSGGLQINIQVFVLFFAYFSFLSFHDKKIGENAINLSNKFATNISHNNYGKN